MSRSHETRRPHSEFSRACPPPESSTVGSEHFEKHFRILLILSEIMLVHLIWVTRLFLLKWIEFERSNAGFRQYFRTCLRVL